ncbi:MAG: ankyrin repeat domain-containing protein [Deltaproteobacteria bacterium]|nr:ankyrin repeat domain-containing protein [Deltaproteobacteria bacterium]
MQPSSRIGWHLVFFLVFFSMAGLAHGQGLDPLVGAVRAGDLDALRSLIVAGCDPERGAGSWTALHQAMVEPDEKIVRLLLDAGADANATDGSHETPLHWAALGGQGRIVDLLLERGARVDVKADRTLWTPLHSLACARDRAGIALALVKAGADPNARDRWGRTPLHWFAVDGHCETVEVLIDAGADPDAQDEDGMTPLHRVAMQGHGCTSTLLRKGADVHRCSPRTGWTALHCSAYGKGHRVAYLLLMAGADPLARDHENRTPAGLAAYTSNRDLQRFLRRVQRRIEARSAAAGR